MAAAIGVLLVVPPGADDHVELVRDKLIDHRRRRLGIVGEVAVRHDIDVGVDVGEHPPHDMSLALLPLGAHHGARLRGDLARPVAAVVVVDVDGGAGQRGAEAGDGRAYRRLLIVAGQEHGDAHLRVSCH